MLALVSDLALLNEFEKCTFRSTTLRVSFKEGKGKSKQPLDVCKSLRW